MTLPPEQAKAKKAEGGRKGGQAKVPKGFAKIDPALHKELAAKGGRNYSPKKKGLHE